MDIQTELIKEKKLKIGDNYIYDSFCPFCRGKSFQRLEDIVGYTRKLCMSCHTLIVDEVKMNKIMAYYRVPF